MSGVVPYAFVQTSFDTFYPAGEGRYYWKSTDLDRLDGEGYERLADLKREWDSDNLFRMNQNIDPDR